MSKVMDLSSLVSKLIAMVLPTAINLLAPRRNTSQTLVMPHAESLLDGFIGSLLDSQTVETKVEFFPSHQCYSCSAASGATSDKVSSIVLSRIPS